MLYNGAKMSDPLRQAKDRASELTAKGILSLDGSLDLRV